MAKYRQRRPKDDWTNDQRRMHTFFIKMFALGALAILVVAAVIWLVVRYLL